MTAPDYAASSQKVLARAPSTRDPERTFASPMFCSVEPCPHFHPNAILAMTRRGHRSLMFDTRPVQHFAVAENQKRFTSDSARVTRRELRWPPAPLTCLLASARRQCVPGRERVHIVSPVRDFPIFNLDDRAKSIVVFHACREHSSLDFIFDDDDPAIVCSVSN